MRVTEGTNFEVFRDSIRRSKGRLEDLQMQAATMKKVMTPSQDPANAAKVLELRTEKSNNDQFQINGRLAETFLTNSESALQELSEIVLRAKEIALAQSSGASASIETKAAVAEEVNQLYQQSIAVANRRIGDRYLFGGYKTHQPPVDNDGRYLGDDGNMTIEITHDLLVAMNVPGIEIFNTHPSSSEDAQKLYSSPVGENTNLFNELKNFRAALLTGDTPGVQNTLEKFDQLHAKITAQRAKIGSRISGLSTSNQAIERHNMTGAQLLSSIEDADLAQVMTDLTREEQIFQAALSSSQRLLQPTLMDFLK